MKRALSLILSLALVLALIPATALAVSDAYGNEVWLQDTAVHEGVTLSDNIYWSTYYSQLRHEYYITYTPSQQVMAVAAYGESVCDRLTASTAVKKYEAMGYRVVGSINGDFYDTATGYPLGLLVSGGEILFPVGKDFQRQYFLRLAGLIMTGSDEKRAVRGLKSHAVVGSGSIDSQKTLFPFNPVDIPSFPGVQT